MSAACPWPGMVHFLVPTAGLHGRSHELYPLHTQFREETAARHQAGSYGREPRQERPTGRGIAATRRDIWYAARDSNPEPAD
jgi:hypothetical protein